MFKNKQTKETQTERGKNQEENVSFVHCSAVKAKHTHAPPYFVVHF